ncbi:branched-chain amino acid ABC transporter substrate-binding protein [Streptomyces pactum]|uniref:Branched-chain amino acid ABC transporter substrate-binding protein n=1 Tax=Streptomyces pactum TaxID=68249 RepID=A0ABS0NTR6_9ACTN|nr:branched-chain amino acid ABC transporter substrate-binding protein [Streptomyces pactum]MBH5338607.1 branched-chain amino acid ABC transporter substrate-binding protein [Streptomyces pactum]
MAAVTAALLWGPRLFGGGGGTGSDDGRWAAPSGTPAGSSPSRGGREPDTTVTIAVSAPLTGDLASFGQVIKNSVDLAVRDANRRGEVPGITFEVTAVDDRARPEDGRRNAARLAADDDVLGVVGPATTAVAQATRPVLADADLAEVSPAATNPVLTLGDRWERGQRKRPFGTFFRTVTTDEQQARFAARYLYRDLGKRRAFVIGERSGPSGPVHAFREEFTALGGRIAGAGEADPYGQDFGGTAAQVRDSGADVVYFGGVYPVGGPLARKLRETGFDEPLAGGDGLYNDGYVALAGGARADGDICTTVGVPPERLASARAFVRAYRDAGHPDPPAIQGGYAYDAAWAIVQAVKDVVAEAGGRLPDDARAQVVEALRDVSFDGVTGEIAFDEYGDVTNRQVSVYRVDSGGWRYVTHGAAGDGSRG